MERLTQFGSCLLPGDQIISFDLLGGYKAVDLHESMQKYFLFYFEGDFICAARFRLAIA